MTKPTPLTDEQVERLCDVELPAFTKNTLERSNPHWQAVDSAEMNMLTLASNQPVGGTGKIIDDIEWLKGRAELALAYTKAGLTSGENTANLMVAEFIEGSYKALDRVRGNPGGGRPLH